MKEMHRSANTLLVRFNEFMARSKVESGQIDIEQMGVEMIPMIEQIEESCDTCITMAGEKNAQDAINDLTKITTAASRFRRKLKVRVIEPAAPKIPAIFPPVGQGSMTRPPMPFALAENQAIKGKLLVVDDDRLNREMIGRRLQHMGFEVVLAEDGLEALEALRHRPFDLVLLDIMMPRLDGHATLERIKANPQWSHIPVVMLTAVDETDSIARCISAGAEGLRSQNRLIRSFCGHELKPRCRRKNYTIKRSNLWLGFKKSRPSRSPCCSASCRRPLRTA